MAQNKDLVDAAQEVIEIKEMNDVDLKSVKKERVASHITATLKTGKQRQCSEITDSHGPDMGEESDRDEDSPFLKSQGTSAKENSNQESKRGDVTVMINERNVKEDSNKSRFSCTWPAAVVFIVISLISVNVFQLTLYQFTPNCGKRLASKEELPSDTMTNPTAEPCVASKPAYAQVGLVYDAGLNEGEASPEKDGLYQIPHSWCTLQFVTNCRYDMGKLGVTEPGKFHFYAQIHYYSSKNGTLDIPNNSISAHIYRYNSKNGQEESITQTAVSPCTEPGKHFEAVLTLNYTLHLETYHEVYIKTSNLKMIHKRSPGTYFGMFRI